MTDSNKTLTRHLQNGTAINLFVPLRFRNARSPVARRSVPASSPTCGERILNDWHLFPGTGRCGVASVRRGQFSRLFHPRTKRPSDSSNNQLTFARYATNCTHPPNELSGSGAVAKTSRPRQRPLVPRAASGSASSARCFHCLRTPQMTSLTAGRMSTAWISRRRRLGVSV
jgi:hypothetical protein